MPSPVRPLPARPTRDRILDAALDLFGSRGVDGASLDDIATVVGVRKQTVLYWFASKDDLVMEVVTRSAAELVIAIEAAARRAGEGFDRVEAVVRAVFRPAIRRPALLGLVRDLNRLESAGSQRLADVLRPHIERAVAYLDAEMSAGRLRRADARITVALAYATVVGVATEAVALRAIGWEPGVANLRRLRGELVSFLRAALAVPTAPAISIGGTNIAPSSG